ncbi:glycosyl hydrolase [Flavobacterium nackdongense]|uniref:T9SS type A sorting domain-containing protein n=1 Tax=Flavobacterium nackdongense TaxID=2547394 RepID=A0A4P6YB92_9FLAO|nr:glycosyl hydrolase [Flavobacterium nackdongense]QBN20386.1 T9SS type A sorting domain-containing protein [Flavobacterium nackdongense]
MKNGIFLLFLILVNGGYKLTAQNPVIIENQKVTIASLAGTNYELKNKGELLVSSPTATFTGKVNFTSDAAWLILEGVLPSVAIASHLSYITVNGQPAVNKVNVRVTNYLQGCVILPHSPTYEALSVFKDEAFVGDEMKCIPYKYYKIADLGTFDNTVSSFKLKKGYMATFAQNENGTGYSKVYIAEKDDIEISMLPLGLNNLVSFVRVFPWRYTGKKGFGSGFVDFNRSIKPAQLTNSSWFYNWGVPSNEDLTDFEFVTMKSYASSTTDVKWQEINNLNYTSHLLGYNEPNNAGPLNMTVEQQLKYWPKFMESGMRLGSPAPTNWDEFFEFMDKCDELNYRVDFVCIHDYGDGTAESFYRNCKRVYDRTKRPIWITEFNWGGNWTKTPRTYEESAKRIAEIIDRYDKEGIIERYAIFNFDEELNRDGEFPLNKSVFKTPAIPNYEITPIGIAYRDQVTTMAFNPAEQINFPFKMVPPQNLKGTNINGISIRLVWENFMDNTPGTFSLERSFNGGAFSQVATIGGTNTTYVDSVETIGFGKYKYKITSIHPVYGNSITVSTIVDVLPGGRQNVARFKDIKVSSTTSSSYPGKLAVDDDIISDTSRWVSSAGTFPATLEIDLKDFYLVDELVLYCGYQGYNSPITNFQFQYWDGIKWVNAVVETNNTLALYRKSFTEVKTNKLRLNVTSTAANIVRLYEIEVYGKEFNSLGVNENSKYINKFTIYPNPAENTLFIEGKNEIESVEIFDINAKVLISKQATRTVDVSELCAGIYFIKVNNTETLQFIKK